MNSSRRRFIFGMGNIIVIAGAMPLLNSCSNVIINRETLLMNKEQTIKFLNIDDTIYQVLYYASLAPSSHNVQPWLVKIMANSNILLDIDSRRTLAAVDPNKRELMLSIGCFLYNLEMAAQTYGYLTKTQFSDGRLPILISFEKSIKQNFDLSSLEKRRTSRVEFNQQNIKTDNLHKLGVVNNNRIEYYNLDNPKTKLIKKLALESFSFQSYRKDAQAELAEWVRFSNADAEKKKDGLTTASMDVTGIAGLYVRLFYDKSDVTKESFIKQGIEKTKASLESYGGWILVKSKSYSNEDLVECGKIFQELCCKFRALNIAYQPMSQILEESQYKQQFLAACNLQDNIQFILRVGYVDKYQEPVSLRRTVADFTVKE